MTPDPLDIGIAVVAAVLIWSAFAHLQAERDVRALEANPLPPTAHAVRELTSVP